LALSDVEYLSAFNQFILKYGKKYANIAEYQFRFQNFKRKLDFVEAHNSNPGRSHSVAINHMSDLSNEEYRQFLTLKAPKEHVATPIKDDGPIELPTSFDWRSQGAVTPVKNQLQCGSSPFFSAVVSAEGCHFLTQGTLVSLSEQDVTDCSWTEGNEGCCGGYMSAALQSIMDKGGVDTEACYPYKGVDQNCTFNPKKPCCGSTVGSYVNVASGDEKALQIAVFKVPVATAVDASQSDFQAYSSGIYFNPSCSTSPDHGIPIVGWGTNGTMDYWILKNSWSNQWGMNGYMYLARNQNNMCGIATMASYALNCNNCNQ
jgi:cathepsin L